jgi:hypothetical protein
VTRLTGKWGCSLNNSIAGTAPIKKRCRTQEFSSCAISLRFRTTRLITTTPVTSLPSSKEAIAYAEVIARELGRKGELAGSRLVVTDKHGQVVKELDINVYDPQGAGKQP